MPTNKLIRAKGLPEPISHYTDAVVAGKTVYVSGQGALDAQGKLVGRGDVVAQTRQVLDNIAAVLKAGGSSLANAASVIVYLKTASDFAAMNEVYRQYFADGPPARTTVAVGLVRGAKFEMDAIAIAP